MAKKKMTDLIEEITADFLAENGLELYNSAFAKEGRDWFLRVYIDKLPSAQRETAVEAAEDVQPASSTQYVSTDDCEKVSRFLSAELDRLDPIAQNYYLEVSSPGMDRELLREKDFIRFAGEQVDISLYKALDGRKTFEGTLIGMTDGQIVLRQSDGTEFTFPREQVAKTKLAVIF